MNPPENVLGAGITEEDLLSAITSSGYPLQSLAVDKVVTELEKLSPNYDGPDGRSRRNINTQEEWSYIDADTDEVRHLDALINAKVSVDGIDPHDPRATRPQQTFYFNLDFLIECKHSELPFVFFLRDTSTGDVPRVNGLPFENIIIAMGSPEEVSEETAVLFSMTTYDVLGLFDLPFAKEPPTAISMSRTYRKSKLELSGEESFRSITLPMTKALSYYSGLVGRRREKRLYLDIHVTVPVVVLQAPLMAVHMDKGTPRIESVPWVRLVRLDPGDQPFRSYTRPTAIDVVHVGYLPEYVRFAHKAATEVAKRVSEFAVPILTGKAVTPPPETEEPDEADDSEAVEPAPYLTMSAHISDDEYMQDWRQRMLEAHRPDDSDDGEAPAIHTSRL